MTNILTLKELQIDALREVATIGAGHAATALSQMTECKILIGVPRITISLLEDVPAQMGDAEEPVAAVLLHVLGDFTGRTLLVFPQPTAVRLAEVLLRRPSRGLSQFTELEQSAIKEAGNILSGAYLNALSDFLGLMLIPSPPSLAIDMCAAVLRAACLQFGADRECVIAVETQFYLADVGEQLRGFFLLLPDPASLQAIMRAIRVA
jgi:chemotaxis protein CheC